MYEKVLYTLNRTDINNFEKTKMIAFTNEQQESFEKTKICYICKKNSENK